MARKRFGPAFIATAAEDAKLVFQKLERGNWELRYEPAPKAIELAKRWNQKFIEPKEALLLAKGDTAKGVVTTYPLNTNAASPSFLLPKYDQLHAIELVGFTSDYGWYIFDDVDDVTFLDADDVTPLDTKDTSLLEEVDAADWDAENLAIFEDEYLTPGKESNADESDESESSWPRSLDELKEFFKELPSGFVRDPYFGLGLNYDLRFITDAVESIDGVRALVIIKGRKEQPAHAGSTYSISSKLFDEVRRAINRSHDAAVNFANSEKMAYANNTLLHPIDGAKYPLASPKYQKDSITRALGDTPQGQVRLSDSDQKVMVAAMKSAAKQLSRSKSREILELSNEIELVTLETLVERMRGMLSTKKSERDWQQFFQDNPFILRLAFGFPVLKMGDQVSVGGRKLDGSGDKIADFVVKAAATGNLGLIEIKTPQTGLLTSRRPYRADVYAPTWELSGAVSQVLDQANHLQRNLLTLKDNSDDYAIEAFAINAVVIAGRNPTEKAERKSFEFYRNSLRSVLILTFDELLYKLEQLHEVLRPAAGA